MSSTIVVFDPTGVVSLTGHPDDLAFAHDFVGRFRRLLPQRVHRILQTLLGDDVKEAMDAVLSLKVSASMIGAVELCAVCTLIEGHVRRRDLVAARQAAAVLGAAQQRVEPALADFLTQRV